jgi:hypothetical protein
VIAKFDLLPQVDRLESAEILAPVLAEFKMIDLHPDAVSNIEMGYIYEELIRVTADLSNEEAGEHFTPREVIRLMANILLTDERSLHTRSKIFKVLDLAFMRNICVSHETSRLVRQLFAVAGSRPGSMPTFYHARQAREARRPRSSWLRRLAGIHMGHSFLWRNVFSMRPTTPWLRRVSSLGGRLCDHQAAAETACRANTGNKPLKHCVPQSNSFIAPHCGWSGFFTVRPVMAQQQASEAVHLSTQFADLAGRADVVRHTDELI